MTPQQIEQVFGRGRLKMATGEHVAVFREAMMPGERRRYTKRFLKTSAGDFGPWTEREWRILARLIGHGIRCVPDVVQFDGGAPGGARLVQTYDAGITVDQWGTLLPVARRRQQHPHVFEDCAHWWSLAHHCIAALDEIHALGLVHLDIKGDNICIPYGPFDFDPEVPGAPLYPEFERLALIDFAFSLVSRESLAMPLPIGWQKDYDYQSPRLLRALDAGRNGDLEPTKELDWRCDLYSLAAMLKRYLPAAGRAHEDNSTTGWSSQRYDEARTLILRLRDSHDRELSHWRPHAQFIDYTLARLNAPDLAASLADGWTLSRDPVGAGLATPMTPITPMTRIAPAIRAPRASESPIRIAPSTVADGSAQASVRSGVEPSRPTAWPNSGPTAITEVIAVKRTRAQHFEPRQRAHRAPRRISQRALPTSIALATLVAIAAPSFIGDPEHPLALRARDLLETSTPPGARWSRDAMQDTATLQPRTASAPETIAAASPADRPSGQAAIDSTPPSQSEPMAAAPQSQAASAINATPAAARPAVPRRNESEPTSDSTSAGAVATAPTSDAMGAGVSAQAQPTNRGAPASRAQPARRASKVITNPTDASAKSYADAGRRSTVRTPAGPARTPSRAPRLELAGVTAAASRPPPHAPTPPIAAGLGNESVPGNAVTPSVPYVGTIEPQHASSGVPPEAASKITTTSSGTEPAPSESTVARTEATPRQSPSRAKPRDDWRTQLAGLFGMLRDRTSAAAPVEDRAARAAVKGPASVSRSVPQSATISLARAAPVASVATTTPAEQAAPPAAVVRAPNAIERPTPAPPPSPATSLNVGDARTPANTVAETRGVAIPAPLPVEMQRTPLAEAPAATRRIAAPPRATLDEARDLATQARRLLADTVPRVASLAEPELARVLSTAANAIRPTQARLVMEAADGPWPSESAWIPVGEATPAYARWLHDQARRTLVSGGDVADALNVELQAFGANPRDPDIAGYLAILYLRTHPARPETARQLALHAIVLSGSRRSTRHADWRTFAIASALTGRELDSVRAFLAEEALTSNVNRSCQTALRAYATYGEPLRVPVLAFMQRVTEHGRAYDAPSCMRSAYWSLDTRASG